MQLLVVVGNHLSGSRECARAQFGLKCSIPADSQKSSLKCNAAALKKVWRLLKIRETAANQFYNQGFFFVRVENDAAVGKAIVGPFRMQSWFCNGCNK
jgi:hypothetical protein